MGYPYWFCFPFSRAKCSMAAQNARLAKRRIRNRCAISALSLAARKTVVGLERMMQIAAATLGLALISFGLSHSLWLSLVLLVFAGFGLIQSASVATRLFNRWSAKINAHA